MQEQHRNEHRTGRRRRAKNPEPLRADVKNFRQKDREQCRGAPEQHREQIEELRTQQLRLRKKKPDPDGEVLANAALISDYGMTGVRDARE